MVSYKLKIFSLCFLLIQVLISCTAPKFDEIKWEKEVFNASTEKLYAEHYKDGTYFNPWLLRRDKGLLRVVKWKLTRNDYQYTDQEQKFLPWIMSVTKKKLLDYQDTDYLLWIGHNTFLIHLDGRYWLTDPMFSQRALLPARKTKPAVTIRFLLEIIPHINIIISHNHYDHLDIRSIKKFPSDRVTLYVPKGLSQLIKSYKKNLKIIEMDWWEEAKNGTTILTCLPAQHWSRRIEQDMNKSLWASYMIVGKKKKIYFGGDSGYFIGYKEFGKKFPNIDVALLPTTAYHPRWFMYYAHMNAKEAIDAFIQLKAQYFVPTQWGTFKLGDNPAGFPYFDLQKEIQKRNLDPKKFWLLMLGEIKEF